MPRVRPWPIEYRLAAMVGAVRQDGHCRRPRVGHRAVLWRGSIVRILEGGFAAFVEGPDAFDPVRVDS